MPFGSPVVLTRCYMMPMPEPLPSRMPYADYVAGIRFRFIQPQTKLPPGYRNMAKLLGALGISFEFYNTIFPEDDAQMKRRLRSICRIPRMSTLAIAGLINRGVSQMPETQTFVNVGLWHGFTFLSALADNPQKKCIGIDNFSKFGGPRDAFLARFQEYKSPHHEFHEMDYRDYFADIHQGSIGFYMYDGNHDYENQLLGLQAAEPFFSSGCIVLVDDTNQEAPRRATLDFVSQSKSKYRLLLDRSTTRNGHPTFWQGIMIFQKGD